MTKKQKGKRVPPLQNEDVTGMTDAKQEAAIQASGRDPQRSDAAREFLDEQREQADETEHAGPAQPQADGDSRDEHAGIRPHGSAAPATQLEEHWDPGRRR
jgi:hypothetical protein